MTTPNRKQQSDQNLQVLVALFVNFYKNAYFRPSHWPMMFLHCV